MYGTQAARSGASTRIPDLLEQLKSEYDALGQESTLLKAQKEDFERKRTYWLIAELVPDDAD